ncbi:hypothetical protein DMB65_08300 [Flavobacterium cheongpyeongense]|uniref:Uncharacterized protein n=1 Tax=Flavobacterium cheongpyeongense TaxID=2212651 RepID=A0A2V4BS36_9FLAO|nr:hypothetical protein [Flavobacterium cheongpyeongense]PXY41392.1 hypothetical protein DMB65_08300 [Flavobacterium cheongpyeongense]
MKIIKKTLLFLFTINSFAQTIKQEKDLLGVDMSFNNSYYNEGTNKYSFGDFSGAILAFNKAIEISPNEEYIYANRADAKFALDDFRGAILDYSISIKINANSYSYNNRGISKFKLNDYRGAIKDYDMAIIEIDKLIEEDPNDYYKSEKAKIQLNRGNAKFMLNDLTSAINDYNLAVSEYEIDIAYFNMGIAKIKLNQKDSGCLDLSKSGELGLEEAYKMIKKYCN